MVEEKVIIKVSADTSEFKKGMKDASESAKDVKKTTDKTGSVAGDSITQASENLNKSGDKLKGRFQGLGAKFSGLGERISTSLGKAVPGIDKITEKLKGAGKAGKAGFALIGATIITAIIAIAIKVTKIVLDFSGKLTKAFNPAKYDAQMGKMKKSTEKLKTTLGVFLEPVFTALTNGLSWIMDQLTAFLEGILSTVGFIGGLLGVMDGVARSMDDMADSMDEASMAADQGLASFDKLTTLGEITGDAEQAERLNKIMADSARMAQVLKRGFGKMLSEIPRKIALTFTGLTSSVGSTVMSLGGSIGGLFTGPVTDGLESSETAVGLWASNARETLNGVWKDIGDGARSLWDGMAESAGRTWETISSAGESVWDTISSAGSSAWDAVSSAGTSAWDTISSAGGEVWNNLSSTVGGFWGNVTGLGASAWESVKSLATDAWTNIGTTATSIFGGIPDFISDKFSEPLNVIRDSLGGLWGGFRSSAEEAISGLAEWVEDKFKKVIDAILAPVKWVIDKLENLLDFDIFPDSPFSGDGSATSKAVETGAGIWNTISDTVGGILDNVSSAVGEVGNGIKKGIDGLKFWEDDDVDEPEDEGAWNSFKKKVGSLKFWADGGVAEPNNPFLAVLGDNRSEREVVTPVSLMRATMREVMMEMGTEGNDRPINLDVNLDGRRIARATYDYMEMERRRRGA